MKAINKTVYIIDLYDKFTPDKIISTFKLNGRKWAIKEVPLLWGVPQREKIEDDKYISFCLYNTIDEAQDYIRKLKQLEGINI